MDSSQSNQEIRQLNRDYKCPCGKTYLSNAAIFTHIKQKHGGVVIVEFMQAPGPIEKPKLESKPRGRPPLSMKNKNEASEKNIERNKENPIEEQITNGSYYESYFEIFNIMTEVQTREEFSPDIWQTVKTFKLMEDFIECKQRPMSFRYKGVCIGVGISEFLKEMSKGLERSPWRFEQILILLILLIQYAIDENNKESIIEEAPVELLIDYMNPFIREHIQDYAEYIHIERLWIMNEQNMTRVFLCFYNWLKWRDYTQYCITLI